jgi:DNA-binding transcriptional MerR regulator
MARAGSRPTSNKTGAADPIPDKLYFKIGEVAELVGVQPHVLRYWEREVPAIRPTKSPSNQRRYRRRDVELFREIRQLLYAERYTLLGARRRLMERDKDGETPAPVAEPPAVEVKAAPEVGRVKPNRQLPLGFSQPSQNELLERVRAGLREIIHLVGEEP